MTEDEMVGWHHRLNGHKFEQSQGDSEGQRSLAGSMESQRVKTSLRETDQKPFRDQTCNPCTGRRFLTTGPPEESLSFYTFFPMHILQKNKNNYTYCFVMCFFLLW